MYFFARLSFNLKISPTFLNVSRFKKTFYRVLQSTSNLSLNCQEKVGKTKSFCKTTTIIQDKPNGKSFVIQNANEIQQKMLNPPLKKLCTLH